MRPLGGFCAVLGRQVGPPASIPGGGRGRELRWEVSVVLGYRHLDSQKLAKMWDGTVLNVT